MIDGLHRLLASAELAARLRRLAAGAPAAAPLSLSVELPAAPLELFDLLPAAAPFWYSARPNAAEARLGIGQALHVASGGPHRFAALDQAFKGFCRDWRHDGRALAFTGFAFAEHGGAPLANALLAIPAILLEQRGGAGHVTFSTPAGAHAQAPAQWAALLAPPARPAGAQLKPGRANPLTASAWTARVNAALRAIDGGQLAKVVLSRSRHFEADGDLDPRPLLAALVAQQPDSLVYAHGDGRHCFLGATPERLLSLRAGQLETDALAGTAWPGSPALDNGKNRHEQALVSRAIVAALSPLCRAAPTVSPAELHGAGQLTHLRSRISGQARPETTLFDLLRALHPTPAVGGYPTPAALDWLAAHGEQRSAWYSGGFGSLAPDGDGEIAVALRSALIHGRHIDLQAGAGIVAGSDPATEFAETEAKMATLLAALHAGPASKNGTDG